MGLDQAHLPTRIGNLAASLANCMKMKVSNGLHYQTDGCFLSEARIRGLTVQTDNLSHIGGRGGL